MIKDCALLPASHCHWTCEMSSWLLLVWLSASFSSFLFLFSKFSCITMGRSTFEIDVGNKDLVRKKRKFWRPHLKNAFKSHYTSCGFFFVTRYKNNVLTFCPGAGWLLANHHGLIEKTDNTEFNFSMIGPGSLAIERIELLLLPYRKI